MNDQTERLVVKHNGTAFLCADGAREVTEVIGAESDVDRPCFAERFAVVKSFHHSQMFGIGVDDVGDPEQ